MNSEKYVFISYAHKDASIVLPCVEAMKKNNINLWFDEGIQAGSEWPEYIAEKVMSCTKFVLFVSRAYLESQNCKRELNFAISQKKDVLSVFIEEVNLSPGMEMQLGTYQAIFKNRFTNDNAFHDSLSNENWFNTCKKEDNGSMYESKAATNTPNQQTGNTAWTPNQQTSNSAWTPNQQTSNNAWTPNQQTSNNAWIPNQQTGNSAWTPSQVGTTQSQKSPKSRMVAALLAIFLGGLGVHYFYLKDTIKGVLSLVFCWTYIPAIISFCMGIYWLILSDEAFKEKVLNKIKK